MAEAGASSPGINCQQLMPKRCHQLLIYFCIPSNGNRPEVKVFLRNEFVLFGQIEMALNFGNMHLFDHLLTLPGAPRRYIAPQHCLASCGMRTCAVVPHSSRQMGPWWPFQQLTNSQQPQPRAATANSHHPGSCCNATATRVVWRPRNATTASK